MRLTRRMLLSPLVTAASCSARSWAGCSRSGTAKCAAVVPVPRRFADRILATAAVAPRGGGGTRRKLERAVRAPPDREVALLLGYGYLQRWRETADASNLPRSEVALRRAAKSTRKDALAVRVSARWR